jgi:hypothetical protein
VHGKEKFVFMIGSSVPFRHLVDGYTTQGHKSRVSPRDQNINLFSAVSDRSQIVNRKVTSPVQGEAQGLMIPSLEAERKVFTDVQRALSLPHVCSWPLALGYYW